MAKKNKTFALIGVGTLVMIVWAGYMFWSNTIAPKLLAPVPIVSSYEQKLEDNPVTETDFMPPAAMLEKLRGDINSANSLALKAIQDNQDLKNRLETAQQEAYEKGLTEGASNSKPDNAEEWIAGMSEKSTPPSDSTTPIYKRDEGDDSVTTSLSKAMGGDPFDLADRVASFSENREKAFGTRYTEDKANVTIESVLEGWTGESQKKMVVDTSESGRPSGLSSGNDNASYEATSGDTNPSDNVWVTFEPIDKIEVLDEKGIATTTYPKIVGRRTSSFAMNTINEDLDEKTEDTEPKPIPFATINAGAKIVGARALDGIIGIVPLDGDVTNPNRFSIKVGPRVLATNGLMIQGLEGMEFYGVASGNFSDSCVRGFIDGMTYIFEDGTIHTLNTENSGDLGFSDAFLGRLVDDEGYECIQGVVTSDIDEVLLARGITRGTQGIANAFAEAETEKFTSLESGLESSTVNGNPFTYAAAEGIAEAAAGGAEVVDQVYASPQISVWVPNNTLLGIRVTRQLNIDYNPNARKINYEYGYSDENKIYSSELD
ncbi:hypothetical protein [Vibrio genomosp. F10]|nr:hypothetical protein [Vibrio genomosp. F10]